MTNSLQSQPIRLGSLPGRSHTSPQRINHKGQVVGYSYEDRGHAGIAGILAWKWDGQMTPLPTLGGDVSSARDINDFGQVVGFSQIPAGGAHACLWDSGDITDLGTLGGNWSQARALNNQGDIVGVSATRWFGRRQGFLWQNGKMTEIRTPGFWLQQCFPAAINSARQVVGSWRSNPRSEQHAFLWEDGNLIDLGTLGGVSSEASDINDHGEVVGWSRIRGGDSHAFLWRKGRLIDLGTLGGSSSWAHAINNHGHIVGASSGEQGAVHATYWTKDPGSFPVQLGTRVTFANDINENGQVVGGSGLGGPGLLWQASEQVLEERRQAAEQVLEARRTLQAYTSKIKALYVMAFTPEKMNQDSVQALTQEAVDQLKRKNLAFKQRFEGMLPQVRLEMTSTEFIPATHTPKNMQTLMSEWLRQQHIVSFKPKEEDNFFFHGMRNPQGRQNIFLFYFDFE